MTIVTKRIVVGFVIAAAIAAAAASAAESSFPGRNGRIAFDTPLASNVDIYVMDADGSNVEQLTNDPRGDHDPRWSPDGERIVFVRKFSEDQLNIFVMDADGSDQTQLTFGQQRDELPSWTADGRHVVFGSNRDGGGANYDLYVLEVSNPSTVTKFDDHPALDNFAAAASRGDGVVFVSNRDPDGSFDLYKTKTKGGPVQRVTDSAIADTWPIWSPTGNDIAFDRLEEGDWDLYRTHADGTGLQQITDTADRDEIAPAWSPDGGMLVYLNCQPGTNPQLCRLVLRKADGTGPETTLVASGAGAPDWGVATKR